MRPEVRVRIMPTRDACLSVERCVGSRTRPDLDQDEMLHFALDRAIEIIGEAAARVSADVRSSEPSIPWSEAVGIRNRWIHAYFDIDLDVLWWTAIDDIPTLLKSLNALLSARSDGPSLNCRAAP